MHINVDHRVDHAVLHLRGEFDTYYVRNLQEVFDRDWKSRYAHPL